uniref:Olfactory receptor n=1 Tax=Sphenodon punctatus TaxID=8508 RepID=A0A8D0GD27_SPHPU
MAWGNRSNITTLAMEFVLLGLSQNYEVQLFLFVLFLAVYLTTWLGNVIIITTVITTRQLHTPLYFLLANLAILDITYSSVTTPKMLWDLLHKQKTISIPGCMAQMFFFHFVGGASIFLLIAMAFDRYLAIHKPLHYLVIMNQKVCMRLVVGAWLSGLVHSIMQVSMVIRLPFCGPNMLDNFYCDIPQVVKLSCEETYAVELWVVANSGLVTTSIFLILLMSYTVILLKIRIHVTVGKHKALSTCAAQVTVVSLTFGPCVFIYDRPFQKFAMDKAVSVLYTMVTPMLNPMIYTLRNGEMKGAIRKLMGRILCPGRK